MVPRLPRTTWDSSVEDTLTASLGICIPTIIWAYTNRLNAYGDYLETNACYSISFGIR